MTGQAWLYRALGLRRDQDELLERAFLRWEWHRPERERGHRRDALLMRRLAGTHYKTLQAWLGIAQPTVHSLLERAVLDLRRCLAEEAKADPWLCSEWEDWG